MSKFYPFALALTCLLVGTACEPRDTSKAEEKNDESRTEASTESESNGPEHAKGEEDETSGTDTAKSGTAKSNKTEDTAGTEPTSSGEEEDTEDERDAEPGLADKQLRWRSCEDGAERALLCDFEGGGGAAICASDAFVELRLARPDGRQSVHRHPASEQQSVEHCQSSSPHRSDESLTFYERGQRLMFETHHINPKGDYAESTGESTEGTVTVIATNGDEQKWRCTSLSEEQMGIVATSAAVVLRQNKAETCEAVLPPQKAAIRSAPHQSRTADRATCGGESAPDAFVDKAAQADVENIHFSAANGTGQRNKPATYTVVSFETSGESFRDAIASCAEFFSRVREKGTPDIIGQPPYQVHADFWRLRYNGHVIVDGARDVCVDYCQDESASVGDFIASTLNAMSLVGPIFSYKGSTSEAGAGGPSYHGDSWETVDLRTMQPADIGALIDPDSALAALQNDSFIRRHQTLSDAVSEAETLSVALDAMRAEFEAVGPYAFHYYNSRKKLVAMRIAFREDIKRGTTPNRMSQIEIWVEPKKAWIPYFEAARNAPGGGFYMTNHEFDF